MPTDLRFECTQCGACCSGEPGFVWVDENEIESLAAEMDLTVDEFEYQFVRRSGAEQELEGVPRWRLHPAGSRDSRKCTVYDARPIQCRTWPFWDSNLKKRKDWKETCEVCPGAGPRKALYAGKNRTNPEREVRLRALVPSCSGRLQAFLTNSPD